MKLPALVAVLALCTPAISAAQSGSRAVVLDNAPIYLTPASNLRPPLRVAARESDLTFLKEENGWAQVQFQDPEFGLRTGWVETRFVRIERDGQAPLNLSVPRAAAASPAPVTPTSLAPVQQPTIAITARPALVRSGVWFSIGGGYGNLGCDACGDARASGASGGLAVGGTITERFLLGVGTTGWHRSFDGVSIDAATFDARVRFYPIRTSGFFINAGVGLGAVSVGAGRTALTETGVGGMFGFGWDIRTGQNVSITPFWNGSGIQTSSLTADFGQIGLGVTVH